MISYCDLSSPEAIYSAYKEIPYGVENKEEWCNQIISAPEVQSNDPKITLSSHIETPFTALFNISIHKIETEYQHTLRCKLIKYMLLDGADPNIVTYSKKDDFCTVGYTPLIRCILFGDESDIWRLGSKTYYLRKLDYLALLLKYGYNTLKFDHVITRFRRHFLLNLIDIIFYHLERPELWNDNLYPLLKRYKHELNIVHSYEPIELHTLPIYNDKEYTEEYEQRFQLFREILYLGGHVDSCDHDNETLLMYAVGYNDYRLVKYLLQKGASIKEGGYYWGPCDVALGLLSWHTDAYNPGLFHLLLQSDNCLGNVCCLQNNFEYKKLTPQGIRCIINEVKRGASWEGVHPDAKKFIEEKIEEDRINDASYKKKRRR